MKYLSKFILLTILPLLLVSCYKDDTTADTRVLSEIGVVFNEVKAPVFNIDKNEVLTIDPVISQTENQKDLKFQWEINYAVVSTEKKLVYPCVKLGSFIVRLKVSNEDGSTYKSFTLNVNSPYEEGLMVLAENESGDGTLSFMRKYTDAEIAAGKVESFESNCFTKNNPGLILGKNPTDIAKKGRQVFITSRTEKKIYMMNDKTFELEAEVTAFDLPDFKPLKIILPDNAGREALILCEQGKLYKFSVLEFLVSPNGIYPALVSDKTAFGFDNNQTYRYVWNPTSSRIEQITYSTTTVRNTGTKFVGTNLIQFFYANSATLDDERLYVITNTSGSPSVYRKTVFDNFDLAAPMEEVNLTGGISSTLTTTSIIHSNATYKKLIYANGNKIYSWFYTTTDSQAPPFITLDAGVVTGMTQNADGKLLYVGVYNAAAPGLKGSIYVYNMDTGVLITKYEGVTDKPVKLFYKIKI